MCQQLDMFSILENTQKSEKKPAKRLNVGDKVGELILGEVIVGTITKVEGNDEHFFYRTDIGRCFDKNDRTDVEQMQVEAEKIRKQYKTIEIDKFDKFFAVKYPPRDCDGKVLDAMVGIFKDMLFWKEAYTYKFLEMPKNLEKSYKDHIKEITHFFPWDKNEREYEILSEPIPTKRLYWSNSRGCYAEARYVLSNP